MHEHLVPGYVGRVPRDVQTLGLYSIGHVVVLASPAPKDIAEAVYETKVLGAHGRDPPEDVGVGQLVPELVDGHRHVPRLLGTVVQILVVLGKQIDVVEDEAVKVGSLLEGLYVTDVHQRRPIELPIACFTKSLFQSSRLTFTLFFKFIGLYSRHFLFFLSE